MPKPLQHKDGQLDVNVPASTQAVDHAPGSDAELWTIGKLLSWTSEFLARKGSESPRLDAEVLLAHVLDWPRVKLYTNFEQPTSPSARARFRELVKRRSDGAPVAYLVGKKEFYSLAFKVSPDVLIPRPDSEFVVLEFLEALGQRQNIKAVDVGVGSGCLAIACLSRRRDARFWGVDVSKAVLEIAEANARQHGVLDRISFHQGDLLAPISAEAPFDVIISNPPYIPTARIADLERDVKHHEPKVALDGGHDGLRIIERLIHEAVGLLATGGDLIFEIGYDQELEVRSMIASLETYELAPTRKDHSGRPRVIRAKRT